MTQVVLIIVMAVAQNNHMIIFDKNEGNAWTLVNDTVMGGKSNSVFEISENNTGKFSGVVSLANNGGFASVRSPIDISGLEKKTQVHIKLKGDGKKYQFRLKNDRNDTHSYIKVFKTSGDWETISFDIAEMYPAFRGRTLNIPSFDHDHAQEVAFLIGNKVNESFTLEIAEIRFE